MVVTSPRAFARAVREHRLETVELDADAVAAARSTLAESGLLLVGESHGVRETPAVLYELTRVLGARGLALEWSHEELEPLLRGFLGSGKLDFGALWRLPSTAEVFCGDGRVTAGHFALLERLRADGRLDQVILFDRLDPDPPEEDWRVRDRELAARLLREWDGRLPLLALTGAFHARLDVAGTMASTLARRLPGLRPAMLVYERGRCRSRGLHQLSGAMPPAPITIRVREGTPATVPGRAGSGGA